MTGRRGRRRKQLPDDLKENRRHGKLEEEALDRTLWRTCRKTGYRMNELSLSKRRSLRDDFEAAGVVHISWAPCESHVDVLFYHSVT
jgi:hypothetical protein